MTDEELIAVARLARERAYCPYSRFPVGAALLAQSGAVYSGANVENASFGLTMCAERVALGAGVVAGEGQFEAIALVIKRGGSPCGACRQVLFEFNPAMRVLMADENGALREEATVAQLLPGAFGPDSL